jgi:hypothetical protein
MPCVLSRFSWNTQPHHGRFRTPNLRCRICAGPWQGHPSTDFSIASPWSGDVDSAGLMLPGISCLVALTLRGAGPAPIALIPRTHIPYGGSPQCLKRDFIDPGAGLPYSFPGLQRAPALASNAFCPIYLIPDTGRRSEAPAPAGQRMPKTLLSRDRRWPRQTHWVPVGQNSPSTSAPVVSNERLPTESFVPLFPASQGAPASRLLSCRACLGEKPSAPSVQLTQGRNHTQTKRQSTYT